MNVFFKYQHEQETSMNRKKGSKHGSTSMQYPRIQKPSIKRLPLHEFSTGSKYEGTWDNVGMKGHGSFNFCYGVDYDGNFNDSMFHERGTLMYPNEAKMDGFWDNGHMIAHRYFYADNLCYGPYCESPDRRYYLEVKEKLKPAGRSFLTNAHVTRTIPPGCYDTGDGFYNPEKKYVFDAKDHSKILRIPSSAQHKWIVENCRKAWDEPVGYKPSIYENWLKDDTDTDSYDSDQHVQQMSSRKYMKKSVDYLCYMRNSRLKSLR